MSTDLIESRVSVDYMISHHFMPLCYWNGFPALNVYFTASGWHFLVKTVRLGGILLVSL